MRKSWKTAIAKFEDSRNYLTTVRCKGYEKLLLVKGRSSPRISSTSWRHAATESWRRGIAGSSSLRGSCSSPYAKIRTYPSTGTRCTQPVLGGRLSWKRFKNPSRNS